MAGANLTTERDVDLHGRATMGIGWCQVDSCQVAAFYGCVMCSATLGCTAAIAQNCLKHFAAASRTPWAWPSRATISAAEH